MRFPCGDRCDEGGAARVARVARVAKWPGTVLAFLLAVSVLAGALQAAEPAKAKAARKAEGAVGAVPGGCAESSAMAKLEEGEFDRSLSDAEACRGSVKYARIKGQAFHGLYQVDSAIHYLRLALKGGYEDAVLISLAESLVWKKELKEAVAYLEKVKDKGSPSYFKAMASLYEAEKKFGKSVEMYDKAIAAEKVPHATRMRKALALSWMKKFDQAIALYTELIDSPDVPKILKTRCRIHRAETMAWNKQLEPAAIELAGVVKQEPGNADARLQLGQVLEWQGHFAKAKNQYRDILVFYPDNAVAKKRLEDLLWVK